VHFVHVRTIGIEILADCRRKWQRELLEGSSGPSTAQVVLLYLPWVVQPLRLVETAGYRAGRSMKGITRPYTLDPINRTNAR
jgi:hypothetical protein